MTNEHRTEIEDIREFLLWIGLIQPLSALSVCLEYARRGDDDGSKRMLHEASNMVEAAAEVAHMLTENTYPVLHHIRYRLNIMWLEAMRPTPRLAKTESADLSLFNSDRDTRETETADTIPPEAVAG